MTRRSGARDVDCESDGANAGDANGDGRSSEVNATKKKFLPHSNAEALGKTNAGTTTTSTWSLDARGANARDASMGARDAKSAEVRAKSECDIREGDDDDTQRGSGDGKSARLSSTRSNESVDELGRAMERAARVSDTSMRTASSAEDVASATESGGDRSRRNSRSGEDNIEEEGDDDGANARAGARRREAARPAASTASRFPKPNFSGVRAPAPLPNSRPASVVVAGANAHTGTENNIGVSRAFDERLATSPTTMPPFDHTLTMPAVWTNDDPSRTVYCVLANPTVSDHAIWTVLSQFGELRALCSELRLAYNAIFAVFYDVRCAERAKLTLQHSPHMFVMVAYAGTCDWIPGMENQGKFIAYNVGSVEDAENERQLRETFSTFGDLKDVRAPRGHEYHRFIEYYDTRHAENAVMELQQTGFRGHAIQIEFAFRPSTQMEPQLPTQLSLSPESPQSMAQYMGAPMMPQHAYMGWNPYSAMGLAQTQAQGYGYQPWPVNQYGHQMMQQGGYNMGGHHQSSRSSMDYQRSPRTSENSRGRSSQSGHASSTINPEEFIFNMEEAEANENGPHVQHDHGRTTLMIRNIPNKYNQSMMLDLLNRSYAGQYDFFYLPIDFKNKCNLGYAFVNFKCAKQTAMFYKEFHNQRWEEFNSRKVCEVTYARVQGKDAMVEHFKNSRFPCENEEYLPLVFDTEGNQTCAHTLGHAQPKHLMPGVSMQQPVREEPASKPKN